MQADLTNTLFGMKPGTDGQLVVLGLPFDQGSTAHYGASLAPQVLRSKSLYLNLKQGHFFHSGTKEKILENISASDLGDLVYKSHMGHDRHFQNITNIVSGLISKQKQILVLGGDHLMTLPVLEGISKSVPAFQVIQLDAHTDANRVETNDRPTHSNFVNFAANLSGCEQIIQIGVRAFSREMPLTSAKIKYSDISNFGPIIKKDTPIYLTIDTDAFDPSVAPGVGHPVINGLLWKDLETILSTIRQSSCSMIGADWMEYNPEFDTKNHITASGIIPSLIHVIDTLSKTVQKKESNYHAA